jgi:phage-related protein
LSWIADLIGSALQNFIQWLINTFTSIATTVWNGLQSVWNTIVSTVQSAYEGFISWAKDRISDVWSAVQSIIASVVAWISTNITSTANTLLQSFTGFTTWSLDIMETAWRRFYDLIKDFGNTLWTNSLNILKTLVVDPLWGFFETLLNKVREKLLGAIMIVTVTPIVIRGVKQVAQGKIRSGLNTIIFGPIAGGIASFILYGIVSGYVPQNPIKLPEIFPTSSSSSTTTSTTSGG